MGKSIFASDRLVCLQDSQSLQMQNTACLGEVESMGKSQ